MVLKKRKLHKKGLVLDVKLLSLFLLVGCSTVKNSDDWVEIDRNNCSSFKQHGKGLLKDGDTPIVNGKVKFCYNNKIVPDATVIFIDSEKDTIGIVTTNKEGKFFKEFSSEGLLFGKIVIKTKGTEMTVNEVYIGPNFKNYYFDIRLPRHPNYIDNEVPKKDTKYWRKEIEKLNKNHDPQ